MKKFTYEPNEYRILIPTAEIVPYRRRIYLNKFRPDKYSKITIKNETQKCIVLNANGCDEWMELAQSEKTILTSETGFKCFTHDIVAISAIGEGIHGMRRLRDYQVTITFSFEAEKDCKGIDDN